MLTRETVLEATANLRAILKATPEESASYADAIVQACGFMQPLEFSEVCKVMLREMVSGRRPVPKQFIAIFHKLADERGWKKKKIASCPGCNGLAFVYVTVRHLLSGDEYPAMKPCPLCQSHRLRELKENPDYEEVEQIDAISAKEKWSKLSDDAKRYAARYAESLNKLYRRPEWYESFIKRITTD